VAGLRLLGLLQKVLGVTLKLVDGLRLLEQLEKLLFVMHVTRLLDALELLEQ
jgi:hypothetical protein